MTDCQSIFAAEEYQTRLARTRNLLHREGWDALLCYASAIIPGNVRYLSGYETRLRIHDACYLLFAPGSDPEVTLFTNASWEHPEEFSWIQNVVVTSAFGREIGARVRHEVRRLAVAGHSYLPLQTYLALQGACPQIEILDGTDGFLKTRMVKSMAEIEVIRRCTAITDSGGKKFLELAREGARERDIGAAVEYAMKTNGGNEVSFTTQVGRGVRTARVVVYPGDEEIQDGDPVQLDCGATWQGYRGDLSRVTVVGRPDSEYQRMLTATEEMYFNCLEAIRPGVRASDVARVGIETAKAHHLDEHLYRSPNHEPGFFGHGIGCHYSESPELHPADDTVIQENMVLVVEPILMKEGLGGVKIEDAVVVTATGAERLSSCPIRTWNSD